MMSSHNRNSRSLKQVVRLGIAAALLIGTAAQAVDAPHAFVFTAYSNGTAGDALLAGDYSGALKELNQHTHTLSLDASTVATNRCVALSVTRQWDAARVACDEAIREAQEDKANLPTWMSWARKQHNDYVALAYSNRAVLNWLSDNSIAAEKDLQKAQVFAPNADFVSRNLTALHNRATVAQVSAVPQS